MSLFHFKKQQTSPEGDSHTQGANPEGMPPIPKQATPTPSPGCGPTQAAALQKPMPCPHGGGMSFLKQVAAVIVGTMIVSFFSTLFTIVMFVALLFMGSGKMPITDGSVLRIQLSGFINEQAEDNPFASYLGMSATDEQGLHDILTAIRVAKTNPKISGIYIEGGVVSADLASLQEIRKALEDFKTSKKFVIAYGDTYSQGAYYVASVADKVYVNPSGMIDWHGLASQPIFYKELLEKVGIRMQVFRVGTYKSAVEPFTNTEMSPANREQVSSFLTDIWEGICSDVSASRSVSIDSLQLLADRYMALTDASQYKACKLADEVAYIDGVRQELRKLSGMEKVEFVSPSELAAWDEQPGCDERIAVYYAYGSIVDYPSTSMSGEHEIVGDQVIADLDELANDEDVKAVVLRINSGGGSAYASEQMWRAIQMLKQKKPVVVSMGGMAASGGYYMSCGADCIVAEPTTLTGSIGIFGMVPDASGLLTEKLGLHFDVVKTNEASDFGAMGRPFYPAEAEAMQAYVERGYALFLKRVADGRGMKTAEVDSIAQGRVWTGRQALQLKLVDELGNLDKAISIAAQKAKLKEYGVDCYPQPLGFFDQLEAGMNGEDYLESKLQSTLGAYYEPLRYLNRIGDRPSLQARIPYEPNIAN